MTVELCASLAQQANNGGGYQYYGVEYADECYWGDTLVAPGAVLSDTSTPPQSQCNMQCKGNSSEICGGSSVLSVYTNPEYVPTTVSAQIGEYTAAGCLTDAKAWARALVGATTTDGQMSEDMCVSHCESSGYRYAG